MQQWPLRGRAWARRITAVRTGSSQEQGVNSCHGAGGAVPVHRRAVEARMTGSPLDIRFAEPAEAARAPAGMAPAWPSSRRWVWLLLAAPPADSGLALVELNPARGYRVLIPFAGLGIYALGFAVAARAAGADGIVLRLAAL